MTTRRDVWQVKINNLVESIPFPYCGRSGSGRHCVAAWQQLQYIPGWCQINAAAGGGGGGVNRC